MCHNLCQCKRWQVAEEAERIDYPADYDAISSDEKIPMNETPPKGIGRQR